MNKIFYIVYVSRKIALHLSSIQFHGPGLSILPNIFLLPIRDGDLLGKNKKRTDTNTLCQVAYKTINL